MADKQKADYFGTFLDAASRPPNAPVQEATAPRAVPQVDRDPTDQVLKALSAGPLGVKDLVPIANNSLGALLQIVGSLRSMGLVEALPDNVFKLTQQGEGIAALVS